MLEETTETPILIGRPEVIERRAERAGLTIRPSVDFELVNPENDPRYRDYWETYHSVMERRGVTPIWRARSCAPTPPPSAPSWSIGTRRIR
jgi:malate dehydrogenase (oxaloacetate-decarboxylating)(NADP+)